MNEQGLKELNTSSTAEEVESQISESPLAVSQSALQKVTAESLEVMKFQEKLMAGASTAKGLDFSFVGASKPMLRIFDLIKKVADTDSTVLVLGESGTGKELVARSLHALSSRHAAPFVAVNCGAIPSELLETELFGHVKGAYTGAHQSRVGRFSLADGGTLFLDEIGTMPPSLQVKILRALQERSFEPVGGTKTLHSDCRVIAATNIDLEQEVERGNFREDLFYRLNVIPINLPALRERKEDIPLLLAHSIHQLNEKKGYKIPGISAEAMQILMNYRWPGNIRELENICHRICILKGSGSIEVEDLPQKLFQNKPFVNQSAPWTSWLSQGIPEEGIDFDQLVGDFENDLITRALDQTQWNKNQAARLLKLNRTTLVEKIKKRNLKPQV